MKEKPERKPQTQQQSGKDKKRKPKIRNRRNPFVPKFFEDMIVKS